MLILLIKTTIREKQGKTKNRSYTQKQLNHVVVKSECPNQWVAQLLSKVIRAATVSNISPQQGYNSLTSLVFYVSYRPRDIKLN